LLRKSLLMRKTEHRRSIDLTDKVAFPCGLFAEFISLSRERIVPTQLNHEVS
jgi:hypothetical protein